MKIGAYEVFEELGRGGIGLVYRARSASGEEVALKVLQRTDPDRVARFERERRLLGLFTAREGFVPLLDAGTSPAGPFLVMPLVPGGTLRARFERRRLEVGEALSLARALAEALGRAHARGVVHRDLKPENVLYTADGKPLIADLGIAKHFDESAPGASQSVSVSIRGSVRGTAGYMAPEQATDATNVGPAADVFALGAILYEGLAGEPPFEGESAFDVIAKVLEGEFVPLRVARPEVPAWLAAAVQRALAKEVGVRFKDALELRRALEPPPASRAQLRAGLAGAGVAAVAFAAVGAVAFWPPSRPEPPPSPPPATPRPVSPPPQPPPPRARSRARMRPEDAHRLEVEVFNAIRRRDVETVLPACRAAAEQFPDDSRAIHFDGVAVANEPGRALEGRRLLARAARLGDLEDTQVIRTMIVHQGLGFDLAAAALGAQEVRFRPLVKVYLASVLLVIAPPYADPVRAREILDTDGQTPALVYMVQVLHARFGAGEFEEAKRGFEELADRSGVPPSLRALCLERASWCRADTPRDRMGHFTSPELQGTGWVEALNEASQAWRAHWDPARAEEPARRLLGLAAREAAIHDDEQAAISYLQAARAFEAAMQAADRIAALRRGLESARRARVDVRALLARTLARALPATDPEAETVAALAVEPPPAGEEESRVPEEIADGWLVVAEVAAARGKKKEARDALAKGLGGKPFDRRPFEALRQRVEGQ